MSAGSLVFSSFLVATVVQAALLLHDSYNLRPEVVVVSHGDFCSSLIYGAYQTQE